MSERRDKQMEGKRKRGSPHRAGPPDTWRQRLHKEPKIKVGYLGKDLEL